jgi:23S rRNA pseudouridine1911/1915/1917 synthase
MVVAKDEPTLVALQVQFHAHDLERTYLELVEGVVAERGSFKTKYGRDPHDRKKFSSEVLSGKRAVTHWRVVERLPGASWVEVSLETGRTHQIRVHMMWEGHPLVGDTAYGGAAFERLCLHAYAIELPHPRTGKALRVSSKVPEAFTRLVPRLTSPFA